MALGQSTITHYTENTVRRFHDFLTCKIESPSRRDSCVFQRGLSNGTSALRSQTPLSRQAGTGRTLRTSGPRIPTQRKRSPRYSKVLPLDGSRLLNDLDVLNGEAGGFPPSRDNNHAHRPLRRSGVQSYAGTKVPWNPKGMRCGVGMTAMGSASMRWASSRSSSELWESAWYTVTRRNPSPSADSV